ncbi:MAG: sulfatase-like hydrolase/transferase [Victivallales bacterium]|nr:sulfatase-like hydrolase/transferase [Victivallales bacterium]
MKKPNIVLIHSDQHRFDCVGVNGHKQLKTPNLDRLAADGVNFINAFTPSPICSPARASLLNGMWPVQHGCMSIPGTEIYKPADTEYKTFSSLLDEDGYQLGYVGKYHQEYPGTPLDYGFHEFVPLSAYDHWRREQGLPDMPRENGWFGELDPLVKPEQTSIAWGASEAIRMIRKYHREDRSFLVRWDPSQPHLPNILPEPYFSMYPPENIEPWPSFGDELGNKPYIQFQQKRTWKVDGWKWEQWAPIVSRYLGEISLLDHEVGRIIQTLNELGIEDNTLFIYTTDHGDLCGAHGMMDKHFIMYDDVMKVPLIIRFPGHLPAGVACNEFVCHELDISRTICDVAGVPAPGTFQGINLLELANGKEENPRREIFGMWHGGQFGSYTQRMVRDRYWKYIWNLTAEDELYNLQGDPYELINRAQDPNCAEKLRLLRKRLLEWMESIDDIMLNPWNRAQLEAGI